MKNLHWMVVLVVVAAPLAAHAGPMDEVNLALGKMTAQSSTYPGGDSSHAVDGNADSNFYDGSVALTYADPHSWWQVDLGQVRQIGRIEITPRSDWCPTCLYPYMVIVSDYPIIDTDITDTDASQWPYLMRVKVNASYQNKVPINRSGRYVRIALQNQNYLQLAEVKVIEQFNSAQARYATQSSIPYVGYDASKAVDGVTSGLTGSGDVAITNYETKPWWQVDMGFVQPIREIHIWSSNVTCCVYSNPKKGLYVFTSTSPITGDPLTTSQPGVNTFYVSAQGWPAVVPINVPAEYVRVQLDGTDSLSLSEVQVFPVQDGATGAHPSVSSVASGSWPATFAVDDNLVTGEIATTAQSDNYLDLDLGSNRYINTVRLWTSPTSSTIGGYYYLFASQTPFITNGAPATTLNSTLSVPGVSSWIRSGNTDSASTTELMMQARYLRILQPYGRALTGVREVEVITPAAIQNGNTNGAWSWNNPVSTTPFTGMGYTTRPGVPVYLYNYQANSGSGGGSLNYLTQASASTTPVMTPYAAVPLYSFQTPFSFSSAQWPQGGMGGFYAITYEDDVNNWLPMRELDADGQESPFWPDLRNVSSTPTPDDNATKPKYLDSPMGSWHDPNYFSPSPPAKLTDFMNKYFPAGGNWATAARFYNKNELGIGREVRCVHNPTRWNSSTGAVTGSGTICLASQFGPSSSGNPVFGDQTTSLAQLQQTSATPIDAAYMIMDDGSSLPRFGGYDSSGNLTRILHEDNYGYDVWAPNACMSCHGGSGASNQVDGNTSHWFPQSATFLPIDPGQVVFAPSPYTYAQQQESIRTLNSMIMNASPKPGVADFINGTYPGGVGVSGSQANVNYVPSSWNLTDGRRKVYNQVIKPYCRMCHMSQEKTKGGFEMTNADDVENMRALVVLDTCVSKRMPHAQQTERLFWQGPARAYLLGFFGRHDFDGENCTP
jgi:hypothetical protein